MKRVYDVSLNDTVIGYLSEGDNGRISFRFAQNYFQMSERPILGQAFEDDLRKIYVGKKIGDLPPFFSNLIPERGSLRNLIERELSEKDDLSILHVVGLDLPGAVIVKPSENNISEFLEDNDDLVSEESDTNGEDLILRFSLAGVQLKFSVNRVEDRLTLPAYGLGGEWIVKIDSNRHPNLVENEYVVMEWARAVGFDVPYCKLEKADSLSSELRKFAPKGSRVFIIQRYDRTGKKRIHQEDFTQVTGLLPHHKYDHITYEKLAVLINNIIGETAYYEFIRRLTFMIASGNTDLHLKNWSIIYPDGINAKLSPLYDQVFTLAWDDISPNLALKFASVNYIRQVDDEAFKRLAERAKMDPIRTVKTVHECLESIYNAWTSLEAKDFLPLVHLETLNNYWLSVSLLKKYSLIP